MSESLPGNGISGCLRVIKLLTGEEIIGFTIELNQDKLSMQMPALLANYATKTPEGEYIEFIKLVNYTYNLKNNTMIIPRSSIIYAGEPTDDLVKMYEAYIILIQSDPKLANLPPATSVPGPEHGLELLNDLFTNEDFVNFVNDLIENFESENEIEDDIESFIEPDIEEEIEEQPKKKKRRKVKPETNKMPYKPENPPNDPESWSDNPMDYL